MLPPFHKKVDDDNTNHTTIQYSKAIETQPIQNYRTFFVLKNAMVLEM